MDSIQHGMRTGNFTAIQIKLTGQLSAYWQLKDAAISKRDQLITIIAVTGCQEMQPSMIYGSEFIDIRE